MSDDTNSKGIANKLASLLGAHAVDPSPAQIRQLQRDLSHNGLTAAERSIQDDTFETRIDAGDLSRRDLQVVDAAFSEAARFPLVSISAAVTTTVLSLWFPYFRRSYPRPVRVIGNLFIWSVGGSVFVLTLPRVQEKMVENGVRNGIPDYHRKLQVIHETAVESERRISRLRAGLSSDAFSLEDDATDAAMADKPATATQRGLQQAGLPSGPAAGNGNGSASHDDAWARLRQGNSVAPSSSSTVPATKKTKETRAEKAADEARAFVQKEDRYDDILDSVAVGKENDRRWV